MPHQCLKCGECYADGSPQILKGCGGCKGSRFFYTDRPLDAGEREAMSDRAQAEVEDVILGTNAGATARSAASGRNTPRIPTKADLPVGSRTVADAAGNQGHPTPSVGSDEWVRMTPNHLRNIVEDVVRRTSDKKPVFRVGATRTTPHPAVADSAHGTPPTWVPQETDADEAHDAAGRGPMDGIDTITPEGVVPAAPRSIVDEILAAKETAHRTDDPAGNPVASSETGARAHAPPTSRSVAPHPPARDAEAGLPSVPAPITLAGETLTPHADLEEPAPGTPTTTIAPPAPARQPEPAASAPTGALDDAPIASEDASRYPEGTAPETIAIAGDGSYQLDVKRLLEKSPIVVHKDGTYSLHLPSLMEMAQKRA